MIENPTKEQMNRSICHKCHWKDENGYFCHAVEPPVQVIYSMDNAGECPYIPHSYWNRIPEERKREFDEDVKERSERYYKTH